MGVGVASTALRADAVFAFLRLGSEDGHFGGGRAEGPECWARSGRGWVGRGGARTRLGRGLVLQSRAPVRLGLDAEDAIRSHLDLLVRTRSVLGRRRPVHETQHTIHEPFSLGIKRPCRDDGRLQHESDIEHGLHRASDQPLERLDPGNPLGALVILAHGIQRVRRHRHQHARDGRLARALFAQHGRDRRFRLKDLFVRRDGGRPPGGAHGCHPVRVVRHVRR